MMYVVVSMLFFINYLTISCPNIYHAWIHKVLSEGVQHEQRVFLFVFFFGGGAVGVGDQERDTTLSGPSSARQRNAI